MTDYSKIKRHNDIKVNYKDDKGNNKNNGKKYFLSKETYVVRNIGDPSMVEPERFNKTVRLLSGIHEPHNILGQHDSKNWTMVAPIHCVTFITADDVWGVPNHSLFPTNGEITENTQMNANKYTIYGTDYMRKKKIYKGDWITVYSRETKTGHWEYVERNKEGRAAVIIGITPKDEIVLIKQHRHPFNKTVVEFPAGLIDKGETPAETAVRELKEETGCTGEVLSVSPPVSSSAGITTEMLYFVEILITDTNGEQRLDDEEKIEWELWKLDDTILDRLEKDAKENDYILSSRLYAYFAGKKS